MDQSDCGVVQGFLVAFEVLNTGMNHGSTFRFEGVTRVGDAQSSLSKHLQPNENYEISSRPLEHWRKELTAELSRWFFALLLLPEGLEQESISQTFLRILDRALGEKITAVWKVEIEATDGRGLRPWYEATWSDFLFQLEGKLFLLHFGVSD